MDEAGPENWVSKSVTEMRKCKQNLRLEVKALDTPFSSKISSVTCQHNSWYGNTKRTGKVPVLLTLVQGAVMVKLESIFHLKGEVVVFPFNKRWN